MLKKIVFYNPCQNGDVHVARSYIQDIINKTEGYDFYYAHKKSTSSKFILCDIEGLKREVVEDNILYDLRNDSIVDREQATYINTWYCQSDHKYMRATNSTNCNFHIVYAIFQDKFSYFGIEIEPFIYYLPKINFDNLDLSYTKQIVNETSSFRKKVLICNSPVLSGQAPNFNFNPIVKKLSINNPDVVFLCTDSVDERINVFNIKELSLNEIGYISTFCDVIVGRASGPYVFSIIEENILNTEKTFICFCEDETISSGLREGIQCRFVWSKDYSESNIYDKIQESIK